MQTYQSRITQHLTRYRRNRLGIVQAGTFRHNGVDRSYGHILPRELRWLNIPEPFRAEVRDYAVKRRIALHRYFHHLNSSQALALSLFLPYLAISKPALSAALALPLVADGSFEVIPDPEEGSNIDVLLRVSDRTSVCCEVKLSEAGFGTAKADSRHCDKIKRIYRSRLEGQIDQALLDDPVRFCNSYQILRNIWHGASESNSLVLFLYPQANKLLTVELGTVLPLLRPSLRERIRVVHLEDVLTKLVDLKDSLSWYAALLREKYVLSAA